MVKVNGQKLVATMLRHPPAYKTEDVKIFLCQFSHCSYALSALRQRESEEEPGCTDFDAFRKSVEVAAEENSVVNLGCQEDLEDPGSRGHILYRKSPRAHGN